MNTLPSGAAAGFSRDLVRRAIADTKKWNLYAEDVLPLWVADMDFAVAEPILDALRERLAHPVFGYAQASASLKATLVRAMAERHGWIIRPEDLVFLPGVEPGFNMALRAFLQPGDGVAMQTPVYKPIRMAPGHHGLKRIEVPLPPLADGHAVDLAALDEGLSRARALLFCNPHNPTGKVFSAGELRAIASLCERHDVLLISDEIHCDLVYPGARHTPVAALAPEIGHRTITLMSASKAWNIAGLKCAFAIIPDEAMRRRFESARAGLVDSVNIMGLVATEAAFAAGEPWRQAALAYLAGNRNHLARQIGKRFPAVLFRPPEASFLAWFDCGALALRPDPQAFFLDCARVAFNSGADFGAPDHVRLNFGCTRATLDVALERMERALAPAGR
jgi:cysteine-S-conjugate beta-lyase